MIATSYRRSSKLVYFALLLTILCTTQSSSDETSGGQTSWVQHPIGDYELKEARDPVEDRLRKEILAAFSDERLEKLKNILNAPWDERGVESLGDMLFSGTPVDGEMRIDDLQWRAIVNMLSYVVKTKSGSLLARRTTDLFDQLLSHALMIRGKVPKGNYWGYTLEAIADYGTPELLTDSFWSAVEQGIWEPSVLESVGNKKVVDKLRAVQTKASWPHDSRMHEYISDTIFIIEMQLQYPELKQIKNRAGRVHLGRKLKGMKEKRLDKIDKLIQASDDGEVRQALTAISQRLKNLGKP